jgi:hypothetical protein
MEGLSLFGVEAFSELVGVSPRVRDRAKRSGDRALAAAARIRRAAPRLAAAVAKAGERAKGSLSDAALATRVRPRPAPTSRATVSPRGETATSRRTRPPDGPGGQAARAIQRGAKALAYGPRRLAVGADPAVDDTATDEGIPDEVPSLYSDLADAAASVAEFVAEVSDLMTALPPDLPLVRQLKNAIDGFQVFFGTPIENLLSGKMPMNAGVAGLVGLLQDVLEQRAESPPVGVWALVAQANAYLRAHPPAEAPETGAPPAPSPSSSPAPSPSPAPSTPAPSGGTASTPPGGGSAPGGGAGEGGGGGGGGSGYDEYGTDEPPPPDGVPPGGMDDGASEVEYEEGDDAALGKGGGGHHHHHHHHRGGRGGGFWGPWPWYAGPWYDDGLELLEVEPAPPEVTIDDVVAAVKKRLEEDKKKGKHVVGAFDVLGAFDITAAQRQMNTLKQVTVGIARAMVRSGKQVCDETMKIAKGGLFERTLPVVETLKKNASHLDWHAAELAKQSDPTAFYAPGDDLKKWVMQAFVDSNAIEEGRATQSAIWDEMWTEIGAELAKMPSKIAKAVAALPGQIVEAVTGVPLWVFFVAGGFVLVLLGYGVYRLFKGSAPVVVAAATRKYLP